ncbi:acetyltransferase [Pedobacter metabolipauper]|uniref:Acetyltransferase EpsM n=1 Tax=Pedobacter metabolipauper TaxID=425513 RepID=A0A4R6SYZ5_9SPHI|nr:acetyltransferase [Pedobacter metabolipauper]TDQ09942.1 acetyltransferase EpsM [Pedobacter metabolipauper]
MHSIYLIGASGHAKVIADILISQKHTVLGVFDQDPGKEWMLHIPVQPQPLQGEWPVDSPYLIAIGNNQVRKRIADTNHVLTFTKAVHTKAIVSHYAKMQEGTVVMAGVTVNVDARIGKHAILNTNCVIDHDCIIGDYAHISPNAALAGNVEVGEGTHIGIGASIIQGIKIGKWATIGAGTVIINDVPDYAVVVGNPGRIIKYNK